MATTWVRRDPPGAPYGVNVKNATASSIEIAWKPPHPKKIGGVEEKLDIHGYEVMYEVEGAKPRRRLLDGSTLELTVKNLKPGMLVKGIVVKARNDAGWGPSTHPEISGRAMSAPPGQVQWVEVIEATAFTVQIRWAPPEDSCGAPIDNYKILQKVPGVKGSEVEFETGSGECEHVCFGLQPGTPYLFTVCGKNESGWGGWVKLPAFVSTLPAPPNQPVDFKIAGSSVSTVTLSWSKPYSNGGDVGSYEVVYEDDYGKLCTRLHVTDLDVETGVSAKNHEVFTITNLQPGSLLVRLRVRASNAAGWGAFSEPLFASTSGQLVAWGSNGGGQLGSLDMGLDALGTVEVHGMENRHVSVIAAGEFHAAAVCDGQCFTWGYNGSGQLGRYSGEMDSISESVSISGFMSVQTGSARETNNDSLFKYQRIAVLKQDGEKDYLGSIGSEARTSGKCARVACGRSHTLVLTDLGEIFTFGDGAFGALGHGGEDNLPLPRMVDALSVPGFVVTDIFCGEKHSACIVEGGQALTWGCGLEGQLGHSSNESLSIPRKVEHLRGVRVATIACADSHTAFVTDGGDIYTCGAGRDGKLGHGDSKSYLYPKRIERMAGVRIVACGHFHTACVTEDSSLYTWGNASHGQLGHPHQRVDAQRLFSTLGDSPQGPWHADAPRQVVALARNTEAGGVLSIKCGALCTLAVTRDFSLWVWGRGPQVQAVLGAEGKGGEGGELTILEPARVKKFGSDFTCLIECGSTIAMAVFAKFPPGVEERRLEADRVEQDVEESDATEAVVSDIQAACFWAKTVGYPVILGATEHITRQYVEGVRGEEVDRDVILCYSESNVRSAFKSLYRKEEQRMKKKKLSGVPKLLLCHMDQPDADMSEDDRLAREETLRQLEDERGKAEAANKTRQEAMEKIRLDQEEAKRASGE